MQNLKLVGIFLGGYVAIVAFFGFCLALGWKLAEYAIKAFL